MPNLGSTIKMLREARELKLGDLAERSGLGSSFLSLVERNERNVSRENLSKIAQALEVPEGVLFRVAGFVPPAGDDANLARRIQTSLDRLQQATEALRERLRAAG